MHWHIKRMVKLIVKISKYVIMLLIISYITLFAWVMLDKHHPTSLHHADAIIVLGAAAWGDHPSPVLKKRINHAITLYRQKIASHIIFTGGSPNPNFPSEAAVAKQFAHNHHGIPESAIAIDESSRNTYENLINAKKIGEKKAWHQFIIVSDSYHLTRATIIAYLLGLSVQSSATKQTAEINTKALKMYVKETNSTIGALIYHYLLHKELSFNHIRLESQIKPVRNKNTKAHT